MVRIIASVTVFSTTQPSTSASSLLPTGLHRLTSEFAQLER
jgi:hypothetical protein